MRLAATGIPGPSLVTRCASRPVGLEYLLRQGSHDAYASRNGRTSSRPASSKKR
jgi:hypothetical protein